MDRNVAQQAMAWWTAVFQLGLEDLRQTRGFAALPTLDAPGDRGSWHRVPGPSMPFPGLFLRPCDPLDALLQLDGQSYADLFFGTHGLTPDAQQIVDLRATTTPEDLLFFGDAFVTRVRAGLDGRLEGVPEASVRAFHDADLRPEDLAVDGWLVPPVGLVPPPAAAHLATITQELAKYERMCTIGAPMVIRAVLLRKVQAAQRDLLQAAHRSFAAGLGRTVHWQSAQRRLHDRLESLAPGERTFEADLAQGRVRWRNPSVTVHARAWLVGIHRSDQRFQPGWEVPGAVAIPRMSGLPTTAPDDEAAFDLAWARAQRAGLPYLYRFPTHDGHVFVGLQEPTASPT
jgi:hypothetical protein